MRRRTVGGLVALAMMGLAALAVVATGSAAHKAQAAPVKAAWIYVGPHNDGGWSQAHDAGRLYVQKQLGSKVITTYKENVPEGPQVAQVIDSLVRDGNKIIFATSFGFGDAMFAAAKKYPDVKFEHATGYKSAKNFANYFGAGEDAIYLSGMAAGAATKTGVIGYVVPFPIPEVIRHANAFALGAQATHPGAKVKLVWTKSWFDMAKEKKAAESLAARSRRDRSERRQPGRRSVRAVEGAAVGRLRQQREEVRAHLVAHRGGLQLGPVLPQAGQGRHERHLEDGELLRQHGRRLHRDRPVRAEGLGQDEGRDRSQEEGDHRRDVLRVPGPALRPEREAPGPEGEEDDPGPRSSRSTGSSRESKAARRARATAGWWAPGRPAPTHRAGATA